MFVGFQVIGDTFIQVAKFHELVVELMRAENMSSVIDNIISFWHQFKNTNTWYWYLMPEVWKNITSESLNQTRIELLKPEPWKDVIGL